MGYENSEACKMLATHCAACSKALVDAASVEAGMGPDCRKKYLVGEVAPELRDAANKLVYKIAILQKGPEVVAAVNEIRVMGLAVLANRIAERLAAVVIEENGEVLAVYTPYREEAVFAMKKIPGRKWDKENKVNLVPVAQKMALLKFLQTYFKGCLAYGKKGLFVVA